MTTGQQELCGNYEHNKQSRQVIEDFITSHVLEKGLDERTAMAYRLDLERMYLWLSEYGIDIGEEKAAERYLEYLIRNKKHKISTITRKYRVLGYYLDYLLTQGILCKKSAIQRPDYVEEENNTVNILSKSEIDAFFAALNKEYENLDSEFRKRVCLRDRVMMELLFYHGIEISELLRLKVKDYNRETGFLVIYGKRQKIRTVYLFSNELRHAMEQWIEKHVFFERENEYQEYLFLSKRGCPLSMKMVILIFDKYRSLAGIEKKTTPKDLKSGLGRYARELLMESRA